MKNAFYLQSNIKDKMLPACLNAYNGGITNVNLFLPPTERKAWKGEKGIRRFFPWWRFLRLQNALRSYLTTNQLIPLLWLRILLHYIAAEWRGKGAGVALMHCSWIYPKTFHYSTLKKSYENPSDCHKTSSARPTMDNLGKLGFWKTFWLFSDFHNPSGIQLESLGLIKQW